MTTSKSYPQLAFCSAITPATPEHYENLKKANVKTVSVCLHLSGYKHNKFAHIHTNLAREVGMTTHAYMLTDLYDPVSDVITFTKRLIQLCYPPTCKVTIWINGDQKYVKNREERITKIISLLSRYHKRENIDIAFYKRDLDQGLYDLAKLPKLTNLTIVNTAMGQSSGVPIAGTWAYNSDNFAETSQILAYDYYGFYTEEDFQLSLVDTDYVVQQGDTWYSVSRRHGIPLDDLLTLNRATENDKLFEGQVVRIA